ncbi:beta-ketoacyl synthase N-terminal-like domain-containing protein [Luedemannella helvata]|uniref:Beta-ketoacyl-[acyl-carrier-protein] synthase family protein n=1 Tax=Luedemannella helvata TaxID=349315 RepID=A0ABP4X003_9ACTN
MSVLIASSVLRTCLGDGPQTFAALLAGRDGRSPLRPGYPQQLRVAYGYQVDGPAGPYAASRWLADCARRAVAAAGVDTRNVRLACLVGTGLRELSTVEATAGEDLAGVPAHRLHFADAVRAAVPGVGDVVTIANACSASGHALALAQDMVELGDADAVLVCGTDAMTTSMLAMIGRVVDEPTERVRPFDRDRHGVLLGEGAAAVVVVPDHGRPALGRLLATGLSCDAHHETAPSPEGIVRAMRDALTRAGARPADVGLVLAHGTGTALNEPAECAALCEVLLAGGADPLVTGVKGAVGHMSGTAALANLDVALRCLATGSVPPTVGLRVPLAEAAGLRLVREEPAPLPPGLVQIDAFGFGGVNAVTLVGAP